MQRPSDGIGPLGALVPGPPWVLGARGAPREAPENTLASLRRAIELGLDGVAYELRACATGELCLLADERLERTTDGRGRLELSTLPELTHLDAGGWFDAHFAGEPLALFEEALELEGNQAGSHPQHLVELRGPALVAPVARALRGARRLSVRVATRRRDTCLEARDAGLAALLVADEADEELARFLRRERVAACGLALRAWPADEGEGWPCERWALGVDEPDELLRACRLPINALTTREPTRALAARALTRLAPDARAWPLEVAPLPMEPAARLPGGGEWAGSWDVVARLFNPFGWDVRVVLALVVRKGAFEARGLPARGRLAAGEQLELGFHLSGGSWSPGGDPLLVAYMAWERGPGRPGEGLAFDAPLQRRRRLALGAETLRVPLLRERPDDEPASVTLRRRRGFLLASIESTGGLEDARLLVHLDGHGHAGGSGLRARLPDDFALRPGGVPFSVAIAGLDRRGKHPVRRARRWAGGLPAEEDAGVPGRLLPRAGA